MSSGDWDILVLDEINNALHLKLVDLDQVLEILRKKPPLMHLVLTGRDAHPQVIELADTVSEINGREACLQERDRASAGHRLLMG